MRAILAVLLLLTLAFAGCASNEKEGDGDSVGSGSTSASGTASGTSSGSRSSTGTGSSSSTGTGGAGANRLPVANLTSNVTSGVAPLSVNFTLDGTDADGDALTWTLSFGDNSTDATGTALPASVVHSFAAGTFTATLTVSDGKGSANGTRVVTVTPATASGPTVLEGEVASSCATIELCYTIGAQGCAGWNAMQQGVDCVWFELLPAHVGMPFVTESPGDVDADFRTDCEPTGESIEIFGADGQEEGSVPAGAACVVLMDYVEAGLLRITIG